MKHLNRFLLINFLLVVLCSLGVQAQETITGIVTNESGESLPGVSVSFKGTNRGTITDIDGNFSIERHATVETLVFSFIGMKTEEVDITGKNSVSVVMEEDVIGLDEVIAIGYGTLRKSDLTGSVSTVSTEGFDKVPAANPLTAIQGKASGVQITSNSGMPGASSEVLIRGVQSINGTSAPIYVVDGVITSNINNLNPNSIESISVLKDASAAAIYGARAANGVILVKTKRGSKSSKPVVTLNAYYGIQTESNLKLELLNGEDWLELWTESYENAGIDIPWTSSEVAKVEGVNTDWKSLMMQTGTMQNTDLSVAGGSDRSNYYIGISHLNQTGMVIETGYKKSTFTINTDNQVTDWFRFGNSLNLYSYTQTGNSDWYNRALLKSPVSRAYEDDGDWGEIRVSELEHFFANPIWSAKNNISENQGKGIQGNIYATATVLKGLDITARGSVDYSTRFESEFEAGVPSGYGWEGSTVNYVSKDYQHTMHWTADFLANYETSIGDDHDIKAMLGYSAEESSTETLMGSVTGTPNNEIRYLDAGDPSSMINGNGYSDWAFTSLFGRVNYNFQNKYLFAGTIRRDGTSRLAEGNRYGVFPSASVAWRITEESFMDNLTIIDDLKVRASVGTLGNVLSLPYYATSISLSNRDASLNQEGVAGYTLSSAINPDLKWESAVKKNVGFDLATLNSRLYVNANFFIEDTYDLLFTDPIPISTGLSGAPRINAGQVKNTGFELETGFREKRGDWSYDFSLNFNTVKNEVVDLEGRDLRTSGLVEGMPVNSYFGYKADGIIYNEADLDIYQEGSFTNKAVGDVKLLDIDGYNENGELTGQPDGKVDAADRTIIGNRYPKFTYGGIATVGYKNWSLQLQLQGVHGVDIDYLGEGAYTLMTLMSSWARNEDVRVLDRYHADKNPAGEMPRLDKNSSGNNRAFSEFWLADASYLRINNLNINYNIPSDLTSKIGIGQTGLYFSIQNAYTFTKYDGPEVDTRADALTGIPQPRTYTFGVKASF
jgi:TonB-linked SusC/RagA family outer membrane protein